MVDKFLRVVLVLAASVAGSLPMSGLPAFTAPTGETSGSRTAAAVAEQKGRSGLTWGACPGGGGEAGVQCAELEVPVDWDQPGGRRVTLALGRLPAVGPEPAEGSVLVAFGGPQGNYIEILRDYAPDAFEELRQRMDVVTWDIRGGPMVPGLSTPVLDCEWQTAEVPDYPVSRAEFHAVEKANRAAAEECRRKDPGLFDHMSSVDHARDMEAIRRALGEPGLNFYGASYGGFFGQAYARLYPRNVRTMVLDGTWNHSTDDWNRELDALALDGEQSMRRFFAWCATAPDCALHGRDAEKVFQNVTTAADREPIAAPEADARYDGMDIRTLALFLALKGPDGWEPLAQALEDAEHGDASGLAPEGASLPYPAVPSPGVVECLDWPRPAGPHEVRSTLQRLRDLAPNVGGATAMPKNTLPCIGWPTPPNNPPEPLPGAKLPPLLGAGAWNEINAVSRVLAQVPGSSTVAYDGPGHTLYQYNDCARKHIDRYLTDRALPPPGTICS